MIVQTGLPRMWLWANYAFAAAMALTALSLIFPAIGLSTELWFLTDSPAVALLITLVASGLGGWVFGRWLLRTTDLDTPSATYTKTRDTVISSWLVLVIGWAAWTFYLDTSGDRIQAGATGTVYVIVASVGIAAALGSGLYLIALAHHRAQIAQLTADTVVMRDDLKRDIARTVPWIIGAVVLLALVFPSDLSPFQISDINRWMERLTNAIGPAFVPKDNPASKLRQAIPFSASRLTGQVGEGEINPVYVVFQIVVFALIALWVIKVFRSRKTRRERPSAVGRVPWGFRWLWDEIKAMIVRIIARWARWATGQSKSQTVASIHGEKVRPRKRARVQPSTVDEWYALVLQRAARRGLIRHPAETPYEFLIRWRAWHALDRAPSDDPPDKASATTKVDAASEEMEYFPQLTDLVVQTRYSGDYAPSWLEGARRAAIGAMRQISRIRWRGWARATRNDHQTRYDDPQTPA